MRVHRLKSNADTISASIGDFELWFRVGAGHLPMDSADAFLVSALLPSMLDGSDIEVDFPVSETLLRNVEDLQDIYHCWNPQLQKVAINCKSGPSPQPVDRIGSFYSGGVDSNHTFLRHEKEITDLIVISGFDFEMSADTFTAVRNRLAPLAESFGKRLVPIETNYFQFERACRLHRNLSHGSSLAAAALMLGFRKIYIPSSHTYCELGPWGSHPLTDRLWANGCTELIHDGAASRRTEKVREIARDQRLLDALIVCWNKPNSNCGVCGKCLRTSTAFRLLGIASPAVPPLTSAAVLRHIRPENAADLEFLYENLELARDVNDREIVAALSTSLRRYQFHHGITIIDDSLLRGGIRRLRRRLRSLRRTFIRTFIRRPLIGPAPVTFESGRRWISDIS